MIKNILALDLGRGSLGVAISRSGFLVTPLTNIRFRMEDYDEALDLLKEVVSKEKVERIVIGYPSYPSGDPCPMSEVVLSFIPKLQERFPGIAIDKQDERYSTSEASAVMESLGKNTRKQRKSIDSKAASVILERYLRKIGQL